MKTKTQHTSNTINRLISQITYYTNACMQPPNTTTIITVKGYSHLVFIYSDTFWHQFDVIHFGLAVHFSSGLWLTGSSGVIRDDSAETSSTLFCGWAKVSILWLVQPAASRPTTASPTFQGAPKNGFGEVVAAGVCFSNMEDFLFGTRCSAEWTCQIRSDWTLEAMICCCVILLPTRSFATQVSRQWVFNRRENISWRKASRCYVTYRY